MKLGVAASVVDGSLVRGDVEIEDGRVVAVGLPGGRTGLAIPGLVDLQVNGFRGVDVLQATSGEILELGVELAHTGVLWYQPTLITAPPELTRLALARSARRPLTASPGAPGFSVRISKGRSSARLERVRTLPSTCGSQTSTCSPRCCSAGARSRR